jgi:hypothetical protein
MAEASPAPTTKRPARSINRWGVGLISVIQVALLAIIVLAGNYLSSQQYARRDWSRYEDYSLSSATTRYLRSSALAERKDPVKWIVAIRRSSAFGERVRALAEEYARLSKGKIVIETLDPVRSPDRAQQLAAAYGIFDVKGDQLSRKDLVVIDARTQAEIAAANANPDNKTASSHVRIVSSDMLLTYQVDEKKQRKVSGFQGEDALTAGLVAAIEGKPRKIYFLADKSRIDTTGERSAWSTLQTTLAFQNILLEPITLADKEAIPADAAGIALVAPKYDLSESELAVIEHYWNQSRSALMVLLDPGQAPPRLRTFLRSNGITPRRDRVITRRAGQTVSTVRAAFTAGIDFTQDLAGQATVFEGASSSLEIRENADDLLNKRIAPLPLVLADQGFWGESKFGDGKETYDAREDHAAPLYLAGGVIRGAESDDRFASGSSRMLVMSNTDFLDPDRQWEENLDFLSTCANWLIGREDLAGIGPRSLETYKLPLLDTQVTFINRINLFFLPAAVLILAAFIWSSRRA